MPRVVCVYFPTLPTDRIRRHGEGTVPADQPLVVISKSGAKRWVSAADTAARKLGLKLGMPASKAQAIVANLTMMDADPSADARGEAAPGLFDEPDGDAPGPDESAARDISRFD